MGKKQRKHKMAKIENLPELMGLANVDLDGLCTVVGTGGPKRRTLERLRAGYPARIYNAYKVGHALNKVLTQNGQDQIRLNEVIVSSYPTQGGTL